MRGQYFQYFDFAFLRVSEITTHDILDPGNKVLHLGDITRTDNRLVINIKQNSIYVIISSS